MKEHFWGWIRLLTARFQTPRLCAQRYFLFNSRIGAFLCTFLSISHRLFAAALSLRILLQLQMLLLLLLLLALAARR
jgi:hypothetical protein